MLLQSLITEFEYEANSTRRLLESVPEKDLRYKPNPVSWTMGELAQHIATIYYWYVGTLGTDVYDLASDHLERGDVHDIQATLNLFETNLGKARTALNNITEEDLLQNWTMKMGQRTIVGPLPRATAIRNFLINHVYHHRGELVVYLRATGNTVPGLYGPTYEDLQKRTSG